MAFYYILKELGAMYDLDFPDPKMIDLAKAVTILVDSLAKCPNWNNREDINASLKVVLIILVDEFNYLLVERYEVYVGIFEQAENFKKIG